MVSLGDKRGRTVARGLTLVELAAALAVIALLVALLLPAIQAARESVRRTQCASQLRQIGTALYAYIDAWKSLPPSLAFGGGSFYVPLLPYLEQEPLYEDVLRQVDAAPRSFYVSFTSFELDTPPLFHCPSTWLLQASEVHYAGNEGTGQPWFHYEGVFGVFAPSPNLAFKFGNVWALRPSARLVDIRDGLSNTVMVCEVVPKSDAYRPGKGVLTPPRLFTGADSKEEFIGVCDSLSWSNAEKVGYVHLYWAGYTWRGPAYNHLLPPNRNTCNAGRKRTGSVTPAAAVTAGSYHPSGVNALYADGRVAFVADRIERQAWYALGTRQGRD
ncbi:MAG: prepilin-type N-terminal cleavage/methylation domain-containing protein [Pirellulaceae bacterium]|nr:MAG: prepilin-type N-terminal cleavage/methylation domain-containing protein [Pirellulaceae bacterium]